MKDRAFRIYVGLSANATLKSLVSNIKFYLNGSNVFNRDLIIFQSANELQVCEDMLIYDFIKFYGNEVVVDYEREKEKRDVNIRENSGNFTTNFTNANATASCATNDVMMYNTSYPTPNNPNLNPVSYDNKIQSPYTKFTKSQTYPLQSNTQDMSSGNINKPESVYSQGRSIEVTSNSIQDKKEEFTYSNYMNYGSSSFPSSGGHSNNNPLKKSTSLNQYQQNPPISSQLNNVNVEAPNYDNYLKSKYGERFLSSTPTVQNNNFSNYQFEKEKKVETGKQASLEEMYSNARNEREKVKTDQRPEKSKEKDLSHKNLTYYDNEKYERMMRSNYPKQDYQSSYMMNNHK